MPFDQGTTPYVSRGQVTVEISESATGGTFQDAGCLVDDVAIQKTWANGSESGGEANWCTLTDAGQIIEQFTAGAMTGTSSITIEAMLADATYQFLRGNTGQPFQIRFTLENADGDEEVLTYRVVKTSETLTMRGSADQTTRYSFDFQINEIISEVITPAGA